MRYQLIALLIAVSLLALGCDRFGHEFETINFKTGFFDPLDAAFAAATVDELDTVMAFYTDDYLQSGVTKADRRAWLEGIFLVEPNPVVESTILRTHELSDSTAVVDWNLRLSTPAGKAVIAESTFLDEQLVLRAGRWLLKGNQQVPQPPSSKQHIIVEYFTFLGCPNCPPVEAKLHELQLQYSDQLSYLEHHTTGPLHIPTDNTSVYYGINGVPASVFQGEDNIGGNSADVLAIYDNMVQELSTIDGTFRYLNPVYVVDGQTITGSVTLVSQVPDFDTTDLTLNYVLIEKVSTFTNTQNEHLRNVVRAKGSIGLAPEDLDGPISFSLKCTVPLPEDDYSLVLFAQTKPMTFANNASIHSGLEIPLTLSTTSSK